MNPRLSLPFLLATSCGDLLDGEGLELSKPQVVHANKESPGFTAVSDFSESTSDERDERIEAELFAELRATFGECEAVFEAHPWVSRCPKNVDTAAPHELLRSLGFLDENYHSGKWEFCEYKDGQHIDDVYVTGWCTDFVHSNGNPAWHPTVATSDLRFQEALEEKHPSYSNRL